MAFTRKEKEAKIQDYDRWVKDANAFFVLEYSKMNMKAIDEARQKLRESGSELHVVKNRLFKIILDKYNYTYEENFWEGNNIVAFADKDAAATAKAVAESTKGDTFKVRGGYLDGNTLSAKQVVALGDLPSLPVMRAMLLGTILAPASKLVRTLAEPARSMAAVVKAHAEQGS